MKLLWLLVLKVPWVLLLSHSFRPYNGYWCNRFFIQYILLKVFVLLIKIRIWGADYLHCLRWKLQMDDKVFQSCVWVSLDCFHRSLHLFCWQNSHRSNDPSNFISQKILEWLCFQVCPKILLRSAKPLYDYSEGRVKSLLHLFFEAVHLPLHVTLCVCLCVQGRNGLRMNACWQRKGLSGGPMWPTFIKMMTKMRADMKKGLGIFRDI